jgi:hypothetical protein
MPYEKSILDYMGVPTRVVKSSKEKFEINALPIRAYVKIWNEFFRDQNVGNAAVETDGDENIFYSDQAPTAKENAELTLQEAYRGGRCLPVNRFHDYFSSCLPYPQRGPEVTVPLTGNAPVGLYADDKLQKFGTVNGNNAIYFNQSITTGSTPGILNSQSGDRESLVSGSADKTNNIPDVAYLAANLSTVTATTINELRNAIAVQQYYEAMARGGSRYREQVQALWDVTISDKTAQIPEYLGGGRYHVNMNQIVQTSGQQGTNDTPIGETGAMSVTPINESSFTKSFEEHGFVIGVMCVRHNRTYQQGLERFWSRKDRLDYYVPQFANLGEQPVKKKEIMLTGTATDEETFGYQEAWADYRMKPNRVSGLMRSNASGTLDFWHYADNYSAVPTLSQEWMAEGKAEIARTLIEQNEDQFFGAIRVANKTTRCMPLYSVPGLYKL